MKELRQLRKKFELEGAIYVIKVFSIFRGEEEEYLVQAFSNAKPANDFWYSVKQSVCFDVMKTSGYKVLSYLMQLAEANILNKNGTAA